MHILLRADMYGVFDVSCHIFVGMWDIITAHRLRFSFCIASSVSYLIFFSQNAYKYDELFRLAEQQEHLIDANRRTIQQQEARGNRVDHASVRLAALRKEVLVYSGSKLKMTLNSFKSIRTFFQITAPSRCTVLLVNDDWTLSTRFQLVREEHEMARLIRIERDTQQVIAKRLAAEKELTNLQSSFSSKERYLKDIICKISSLQSQVKIFTLESFVIHWRIEEVLRRLKLTSWWRWIVYAFLHRQSSAIWKNLSECMRA